MRVVVFLKSILDPEAPPGMIKFDGAVQAGDASQVLGPFESNALELGVQLAQGGGELLAVAAGGAEQEVGLRKALALGAASATRIDVPPGFCDPLETARLLRDAVQEAGGADVHLFGRQAGDWDLGVTAGIYAGLLDLPFVPLVQGVEPATGRIRVRREIPGGYEESEVATPVVLSATNGPQTLLRLPKVKDVMLANRKPIAVRQADGPAGGFALRGMAPSDQRRAGQRIEGDLEAKAQELAAQLRRNANAGGGD